MLKIIKTSNREILEPKLQADAQSEEAYVECPSENQVPTITGRCPEAISRRVMRSIAYNPR